MINWNTHEFSQLNINQLHDIYALRQQVFILEQTCLYPDIDGLDKQALHVLGSDSANKLIAYLRIVPPGFNYAEPSIGRVLVDKIARGSGLGEELIRTGIEQVNTHFPGKAIRISAQCYLIDLYQRSGFEIAGDEYLEDGIPHIEMLYGAAPTV